MLDIILKILSVLGILLLALLALLVLALLLVLFVPVTYKVRGKKAAAPQDGEASQEAVQSTAPQDGAVGPGLELSAKMNWLFGFFRVRYAYPDPGVLTVRVLWFRLLRRKPPSDAEERDGASAPREEASKEQRQSAGQETRSTVEESAGKEPQSTGKETASAVEEEGLNREDGAETSELKSRDFEEETVETVSGPEGDDDSRAEETGGFFKKFQKIKYTICSIYDKIKEIWQNISYYTALLREEDTKQLFAHVKLRLFRILKNIRPRHISAELLFGTGAPDTTGCIYGVYSMLYPVLGDKCLVTPDFERRVLEGRFDVSGHITVWVLVVNAVKLMLDRRLRLFIRKMKKEEIKNGG